jgi:hypothetical protein
VLLLQHSRGPLADAITVRERSEIAMQGIRGHIPAKSVMVLYLG